MNQNPFTLLLLLFATFLSGCALKAAPPLPPLTLEGSATVLSAGDFADTKTGEVIPLETLARRIGEHRVIYIGEIHISLANHKMQQNVIEALYKNSPDLTIALEMFPRSAQSSLDAWTAGNLSEEEFLSAVAWEDNWGYPFRLYRPIFNFARDHRMRMVALNAPKAVVRKVAEQGIAGLSEGERALIAGEIDRTNEAHRAFVRDVYEAHNPEKSKSFDTFYESQLTWDETMAESVVEILASERGRVVVLAGSGHVRYGYGIPERAARRASHSYATIAPVPVGTRQRPIDPAIADFIWILPKFSPHPSRGRIGVLLREVEGGNGLEILKVVPDSNAHRAGIRKGDIFLTINDKAVNDVTALHRAMAGKGPDHDLVIRRGEGTLPLKLTIRKEED